ncbi:hypothetical protein DPMN_177482 [Dreissena polymorpha]|uniref:B box-type domain-containing protein n=1 Tax=Dreissena polymorpha TaxID=45954 RepID=A0A9D4EBR7_DREPO|nr:hypothetical protein DPMN_177482 [Dreissena polymorpha]
MATFSQSTVDKGSDSFTDFCCSPCKEHNFDQWAEFYCTNCQKCYCAKCINLHSQLFGKHVTYGRGDTSKWPVFIDVFTVKGYDVGIASDSSSCHITAVCVLSHDQILVADNANECVKLLDLQYQVVGHCDLYTHPRDMCLITPSEVAVTVNKDKTHEVQFVSVNVGQLVKGMKLQFQHECYGIAHDQKDLYLTTGTALYKYSMSGDLLNKLYEKTSGKHSGNFMMDISRYYLECINIFSTL